MTVPGRLRIVGIGPGGEDWLTKEASRSITEANDLVGYSAYIDRLPHNGGQRRHPSGNGTELERARHALRLTEEGRDVALISGGDPGIFAMAAAVFEVLDRDPRWRGVDIRVCPGISAMQAAAARIGAPLGHDFCVISLSENLKPWSLIEKRLLAAASADFVIALYNPASGARPRRIHDAFALLREVRAPTTPVVFAHAIGREDERIVIETLGATDPGLADMSTLVLIGSSRTRLIPRKGAAPFVYTPRGTKDF
ncbi:MAG TPA: precorrin-3B C(17)-methyltransferase [Methylocella sp.]|nr:precorrin-3B C(17)-methyltransferase [Methylocella sp.]